MLEKFMGDVDYISDYVFFNQKKNSVESTNKEIIKLVVKENFNDLSFKTKEKSSVGETIINVTNKEKNVLTETFVADISKPLPQEWDWWNTEDDDVWDNLYGEEFSDEQV